MLNLRVILRNIKHRLVWNYANIKAQLTQKSSIDTYLSAHRIRKLNLGCWPYPLNGWLNTDLYGNSKVVPLNLIKRFPIPDSTFHYIYCEHTIEHFDLLQVQKILKECYRILKPGGTIRLATPDIAFLISMYKKNKTKTQINYLKWSGQEFLSKYEKIFDSMFINNFFRAWGHQFIFDFQTLKYFLLKTGFKKVTKLRPGDSRISVFKNIERHWKSIGSQKFNNLETFVAEGVKL